MEYHGFRSIKEYENECARVGFTTRRVPFHKDGEAYFALITTPHGHDVNYLGKLFAHGYRPDSPQALGDKAAPALSRAQRGPREAPAAPKYPVGEGGQICFLF